jgi:hypothetical protein
MNGLHRLSLAGLALGAAFISGCVGYEIKPEPLKAPPYGHETPLPLRVAVVEGSPDLKPGWGSAWLREGDAHKLTETLRYSGLFREVEGVSSVGPSSSYDVIVNWKLLLKYHVGIFPFLPLCDPLIIGCFLDNTDTVKTEADAIVTNGAGAGLKDYHEAQDTTLIYKIGSLGKRETARTSSLDHVVALLVTRFLADREFYRGLAKKGIAPEVKPTPKPEPAAEPEPSVAATTILTPVAAPTAVAALAASDPVESVRANADKAQAELAAEEAKAESVATPAPAPTAAPPAAEPERVESGPLTPTEQAEIDDQVMP